MQGDIAQAQHAYTPLTAQGEAALDATETSLETLSLLLGDANTRDLLMNFPKRYLGAHSSVEQTRMAGIVALDILLILAGAVAGGALAAMKHSEHFTKASELFSKLAAVLKSIKHKKTVNGHTDQRRIEVRADEDQTAATAADYGYDVGGGIKNEITSQNVVKFASGPVEAIYIKVDGGTIVAARQGASLTFVNDLDSFRLSKEVGILKDRLDVVSHGSPGSINVAGQSVDAPEFANMLSTSGQLEGISNVKLFSCSIGCDLSPDNNFAQRLANEINLPVIAPNRDVLSVDGKLFVADDLKFDADTNQWIPVNPGEFLEFKPSQ